MRRRPNSQPQTSGRNGTNVTKARPPPVTGRKVGSNLTAVPRVKKARVFVSRLSPDLSTDVLKEYVADLVKDTCDVEKLSSKYPTYSSFLITCNEVHKEKLLSPEEWEEGILIRPFFGEVKNRAN